MIRRTSILIDDELLGRAQQALGTTGLKDTVEAAFMLALRRATLQRLTEEAKTGELLDFEFNAYDRDEEMRSRST